MRGVGILPSMAWSTYAAIARGSLQLVGNGSSIGWLRRNDIAIDPTTVALLSLPSMATAAIGARLALRMSDGALKVVFGAAVAALAPYFAHTAVVGKRTAEVSSSSTPSKATEQMRHAIAGTAMGFATGLVGVGAGPIVVTYLSIFTDLSQREVTGSSPLSRWDVTTRFSHETHHRFPATVGGR